MNGQQDPRIFPRNWPLEAAEPQARNQGNAWLIRSPQGSVRATSWPALRASGKGAGRGLLLQGGTMPFQVGAAGARCEESKGVTWKDAGKLWRHGQSLVLSPSPVLPLAMPSGLLVTLPPVGCYLLSIWPF